MGAEGCGVWGEALVSVVDDDPSARDSLVALVRALGFRALAFEDAAAFLASDVARGTGCLIADLRMPALGGLDLLEKLRATGRLPPAILVTAYPDETTRERARAAGIICYLAKPVVPDELFGCIHAALGGHGDALFPETPTPKG